MATKKTESKAPATRKKVTSSKAVAADPSKAAKAAAKPKSKSTGRKTRAVGKSTSKLPAGLSVDPVAAPEPEISHDQIALRAYFIAERRQKMGWHGDSHSDWVEAHEQLKAEALRKPLKKR